MEKLNTPAVMVDQEKLEANIADMAKFAAEAGVQLRPHAKAHKTPEIALKQVAAGAVGITAAKLREAEVMLEAGIRDILIATQITGELKVRRLLSLMERGEITTAVDSIPGALLLAEAARDKGEKAAVVIEVDCGLNRCGVLPGEATLRLARELARIPGLQLKGLFTHAGQAYGAAAMETIAEIGRNEGEVMAAKGS